MNQRDNNGKKHGIWEHCYNNGKLYYKGNYKNGEINGYREGYYYGGELCYKQFTLS